MKKEMHKEKDHEHKAKKPHAAVDDEKLQEVYENALGDILDNDDEDAKDNLADYMDELKEESENVGRPSKSSSAHK